MLAKDLAKEIEKVNKNKVIFYDNNFLANPNIKKENMLESLANLRIGNTDGIEISVNTHDFSNTEDENNNVYLCILAPK